MTDSMKIYTYGNAIEIQANIYNVSDVLVDPQNGVKITITDSAGTKVVNDQSMSSTTTGVYTYDWQATKSSVLGIYTCEINVDGASYDAVYISNRLFELVAFNE